MVCLKIEIWFITKGLPPEDPGISHSPQHVPSATQMGQGRIRKIVDYQSKSGERSRYRVAKNQITILLQCDT